MFTAIEHAISASTLSDAAILGMVHPSSARRITAGVESIHRRRAAASKEGRSGCRNSAKHGSTTRLRKVCQLAKPAASRR
jgi:hypothetical protein